MSVFDTQLWLSLVSAFFFILSSFIHFVCFFRNQRKIFNNKHPHDDQIEFLSFAWHHLFSLSLYTTVNLVRRGWFLFPFCKFCHTFFFLFFLLFFWLPIKVPNQVKYIYIKYRRLDLEKKIKLIWRKVRSGNLKITNCQNFIFLFNSIDLMINYVCICNRFHVEIEWEFFWLWIFFNLHWNVIYRNRKRLQASKWITLSVNIREIKVVWLLLSI
jgi:hypothetical protein